MTKHVAEKADKDSIRITISIFFITFSAAVVGISQLLFGVYGKGSESAAWFGYYIAFIYISYFISSILLTLFISLRAITYRYKNKNMIGSRDSIFVSPKVAEHLYDYGIESFVSAVIFSLPALIVVSFLVKFLF